MKTISKNILWGILLTSIGLACLFLPMVLSNTSTPRSDAAPIVAPAKNLYVEARRSVVGIQVDGRIHGTGFVVQKGGVSYIWTAAHVVTCDPGCPEEHVYTITQRIEYQDVYVGRTSIAMEVVKVDPVWDIALLKSKIVLPVPGLSFSRGEAEIGDPIFHIGNMLGRTMEGSLTFGHLSKRNRNVFDTWARPLDQIDINAMPGSSGAPVFNETGEVIGILVGGFQPGVDAVMVPVRDIVEWARDNDLLFALWTSKW